jgi:putative aldouronate transport system substrate-binding protein
LSEAGTPEREKKITNAWEERVQMNPTITFVFDDTSVKSYVSAVSLVLTDYVPMDFMEENNIGAFWLKYNSNKK